MKMLIRHTLRGFAPGLGLALLMLACGAQSTGTGNTNWEVSCDYDSECSEGQVCGCDLCGPDCDGQLVCNGDQAPSCEPSESGEDAGPEFTPDAGTSAQGSADSAAPYACPQPPSGVVEPQVVSARFQRVEEVADVAQMVIDDDWLYWIDHEGQVQSQIAPTDGTPALGPPSVLRPAQAEPLTVTGPLLADATTLYWAEANVKESSTVEEPMAAPPPGRIYALSKDGAQLDLLLEDPEQTYALMGIHAGELLLSSVYTSDGLFALSLGDGQLRPWAPNILYDVPQITPEGVYWREASADSNAEENFDNLFRAELDGEGKQFVTKVRGISDVFGDLVLWQEERTLFEPLVLEQNFVVFDRTTGCEWRLPNAGESISYSYLADQEHAYWHSYNAVSSTPSDTKPLLRVDLRSGVLQQLDVPGLTSDAYTQIVGQTDDKVYVNGPAGLVAIEKATDADVEPEPGECIWGVDNLLASLDEQASDREYCGSLDAQNTAELTAAVDCFNNAAAEQGAQFTVDACLDCTAHTVFVATPTGSFYKITLETDASGDDWRTAAVEQCESISAGNQDVICFQPTNLYTCMEPR